MDNLKNLANVIFPSRPSTTPVGWALTACTRCTGTGPTWRRWTWTRWRRCRSDCWRRGQQEEQPAAVAAIRAVVPEAGQQQPAGGEGEVQLPQREEEPAEPAAVQPGDQPASQQGTARGSRVLMSPLPLVLTPRVGRGGPEGWSKEWAEEMPLPNSFEECVLLVRNSYASRVMEGWLQRGAGPL
jgi:hypothetical protein